MARVTKSPEVMASEVFANFGKYDPELDVLTNVDIDNLRICVNLLNDYLKTQSKKEVEAKSAVSKVAGKKYYDSLPNGAEFTVIIGKSKTLVKKVATASGESGSARCSRIVDGVEKVANIHFDKVVIPESVAVAA